MKYFTQLLFENIKVLQAFSKQANVTIDKVEEYWKEAKSSVKKSHPELDESNDSFWKIVTTIVKKRLKI